MPTVSRTAVQTNGWGLIKEEKPNTRLHEKDYNQDLGADIKALVQKFLAGLGNVHVVPPDPVLREAVQKRIKESGIVQPESSTMAKNFENASAFAEHNFVYQPLETKVYIAMYVWVIMTLDDKDSTEFAGENVTGFHRRFCSGLPQPTPSLQTFADIIRETYDHFDPAVAGIIIGSTWNGSVSHGIENREEMKNMKQTPEGGSYARWLRARDGYGEAMGCFAFPKETCTNFTDFLEAVPDIGLFIDQLNDILSFYKEEMAGETTNFVHNRARYERKDVLEVLGDLIDETLAAHRRILSVLKGKDECVKAWERFVRGYAGWHTAVPRYRLAEIGVYGKK